MRIEFDVIGEPAPQGSKRTVPIRNREGRIVQKNGRDLTRTIEDNPRLPQWRQEVAQAAKSARESVALKGLLTCAVALTLEFYRPRPKGDFGTGRNAGKLKASAPPYAIKRPDTLKLARAVEDALTGVVWVDDSQVVRHSLSKDWGDYFRVRVVIETLGEGESPARREREKEKALFA